MPLQAIKHTIILGSKSPRRQQLLKEMGIEFEARSKEVDESIPKGLKKEHAAIYLSKKKAAAFVSELSENELLITSDTIVCKGSEILSKPSDKEEAEQMLRLLSNSCHEVITAVSLTSSQKQVSFHSNTKVFFKALSKEEIEHYITKYQPFDKAGAYGIQEWIGMIGINKIEGSFYNVMGLPVDQLYAHLIDF